MSVVAILDKLFFVCVLKFISVMLALELLALLEISILEQSEDQCVKPEHSNLNLIVRQKLYIHKQCSYSPVCPLSKSFKEKEQKQNITNNRRRRKKNPCNYTVSMYMAQWIMGVLSEQPFTAGFACEHAINTRSLFLFLSAQLLRSNRSSAQGHAFFLKE